MNKSYIGQPVRLIKFSHRVPIEFANYFGAIGIVKGFRLINYNFIASIVEFDAHTRIWLFEEEIKVL
nr:hypothetical protein CVCH_175 [Cavernulicola chilensis]